jgi:hypothetical protein
MVNSALSAQEVLVLENAIEHVVPEPVKILLEEKARARFGNAIYPVGQYASLNDGFRCSFGKYSFWFNDAANSTHVVFQNININR